MHPALYCYENWGRVGPRVFSIRGKLQYLVSGKSLASPPMELHQLSGIFCLKLNGKGVKRFVGRSMKLWITNPKGLGASAV